MALYEVPDNTLKNLLEFLKRTDLKGSESPAFNEVISCFMQPVAIESPIEEIKNK